MIFSRVAKTLTGKTRDTVRGILWNLVKPACLALVFIATLPVFAQEIAPLSVFRDCDGCPEMVVIPPGEFTMGARSYSYGLPLRKVTINYTFAAGKFEVTVDEYAQFIEATGAKTGGNCLIRTADYGLKDSNLPVQFILIPSNLQPETSFTSLMDPTNSQD